MSDPKSRKGIGPNTFRRSALSIDTSGDAQKEESLPPSVLRKHKRELSFVSPPINPGPPSPSSPKFERASSGLSLARSPSPKTRPKGIRRSTRTSSIFSSIRSFQSLHEDFKDQLTRSDSNSSSIHEGDVPFSVTLKDLAEMPVLKHGEVSISTTVVTGRSKKTVYLVLADKALLKFKSQSDAARVFSEVPDPRSQGRAGRHSRTASTGSFSALASAIDDKFPLANIIAVYKLDNGLPFFSWEIAYWDEYHPKDRKAINFHPEDDEERHSWITAIRQAVLDLPRQDIEPFPEATVRTITKALDRAGDYDPKFFRLFRVAKRALKDGKRHAIVDLSKLTTSVGYLAIGIHKVHFLPSYPSANDALGLVDFVGSTHFLLNVYSISLQPSDDLLQLIFRRPLERSFTIHLMSSFAADIALSIRQSVEYLRPEWRLPSFWWDVPRSLNNSLLQPLQTEPEDDEKDFDRTLIAHCLAYEAEASNIRYCVNKGVNEFTEFELLSPANARQPTYTAHELLAILRSLRYNDTFHAFNFRHISLDVLRNIQDFYDDLPGEVTFGDDFKHIPDSSRLPHVLIRELQALVLKNKKLRRVDFTGCIKLPNRTKVLDNVDDPEEILASRRRAAKQIPDVGTGICEALFPLCKGDGTDLDWIVLSEIQLAEADVECMWAYLTERTIHLRGLELNRCGLTNEQRDVILRGLRGQKETLEVLVLSENHGRSQPRLITEKLTDFSRLRVLNLSKFSLLPSEDPLLSLTILKNWRLEELILSHIPISQATVDHLVDYVRLEQSSTLKRLLLDGCSLNGGQIADILEGLSYSYPNGRPMHLDISHDKLGEHHDAFVNALSTLATPTQITMHSIEYRDQDSFRHFLSAITRCTTLVSLDISQIYLHTESDAATGAALFDMLANNAFLEELNLSGSHTTLEVDTFGNELCNALKGLQFNQALRILWLDKQRLAQPGIGVLAEVLRQNNTLQELHCDGNNVGLQCFTGLVRALENNHTLLYLSDLEQDRAAHEKHIEREYHSNISASKSATPSPTSGRFRLSNWMNKGNFSFGSSSKAIAATPQRMSQTVPSTPAIPYPSIAAGPLPLSASLAMTPISAPPIPVAPTPRRLSKAPKKKASLPQLLKRTISRQSSRSPVLDAEEYEAGMRVYKSQWDLQVARRNYFLRRNWCQLNGWLVDVEEPKGPHLRTAGSSQSMQHTPTERSPLSEGVGIADGGEEMGEEVDDGWVVREQRDEWEGRKLEEGEVVSPLLGEEEETPRGELQRRLEAFDLGIGGESVAGSESASEEGSVNEQPLTMGNQNPRDENVGEHKTPRGSMGSFTGEEKENFREVLRVFGEADR